MKALRKGEQRLARRVAAYESSLRSLGPGRSEGFTRPGSMKKPAPKGR